MDTLYFHQLQPFPVNSRFQFLPNSESIMLVNSDGIVGLYTYVLDPSQPTPHHYKLGTVIELTAGGSSSFGYPIEPECPDARMNAVVALESRRAELAANFIRCLRSPRTVIVRGRALTLHNNPVSDNQCSFLGFGGARWNLRTHDGREFSSRNVWDQGQIPIEWGIPDNCTSVASPSHPFPEIPDDEVVWEPLPDTLSPKEVINIMAKKPAKPVKGKPCK